MTRQLVAGIVYTVLLGLVGVTLVWLVATSVRHWWRGRR